MTIFTYSQARQNFASVLDIATKEGEVVITRRDGRVFRLTADKARPFSLADVKGIKTKATTKDIVKAVREGRDRGSK